MLSAKVEAGEGKLPDVHAAGLKARTAHVYVLLMQRTDYSRLITCDMTGEVQAKHTTQHNFNSHT